MFNDIFYNADFFVKKVKQINQTYSKLQYWYHMKGIRFFIAQINHIITII